MPERRAEPPPREFRPLSLHPVNRTHIEALSDAVGVMQHAAGARPDPSHGYCTDDVARALQVDLLHERVIGWPQVATSAWRALAFLTEAFDDSSGRFRNFRLVDGSWADGTGSDDCQGRALHALGDAIAAAPEPAFAEKAAMLFERALPTTNALTAIRPVASAMLACDAAIRGGFRGRAVLTYQLMTDRLRGAFEPRLDTTWPWPEARVTYENGLPVRALIVAGQHHGARRMVEAGTGVLDWLISAQTAPDGHLSPIGNGWWLAGGEKSQFDQQPIEPTALLLAAEAAHAATGAPRYREVMERSYAWFLGENDLRLDVADPLHGACNDGLTAGAINTNQGAESTLMWLTALEHVRERRANDRIAHVAMERPAAAPVA